MVTAGLAPVVLDLRPEGRPHAVADDPDAGGTPADATAQLRAPEDPRARVLRYLVIDTPTGVLKHADVYQRIRTITAGGAANVELVCLVVPSGDDPAPDPVAKGDDAPVLALPAVLKPPGSGVLWVRDLSGGAGGRPDDPLALQQLVELLCTPEVFDAVFEELITMPYAVACPGLRVLRFGLADGVLAQAKRSALAAVSGDTATAGRGAPPALTGVLADLAALASGQAGPGPRASCRAAGGPLDVAHRRCDDLLARAADAQVGVAGVRGLIGQADSTVLPGMLRSVADALHDYRNAVEQALDERVEPGDDGMQRAVALEAVGVVLPTEHSVTNARIDRELHVSVRELCEARKALRETAAMLDDYAGRVGPSASSERFARLAQLCPKPLLAALRTPQPFLLRTAAPGRVAGTAVGVALAALWPLVGLVLGPLVMLAALAGAWLAQSNRPGRFDGERVDIGFPGLIVAGVAGAAAGTGVALSLEPPALVGAFGAVVGLGLVAALSVRQWRAAVDRWWIATQAPTALGVPQRLDALVTDVVINEWYLIDERTHASNVARRAALLLRLVADSLDETSRAIGVANAEGAAGDETAPRRPLWLTRQVAHGSPALAGTLTQTVSATVVRVVLDLWDGAVYTRTGALPDLVAEYTGELVSETLAEAGDRDIGGLSATDTADARDLSYDLLGARADLVRRLLGGDEGPGDDRPVLLTDMLGRRALSRDPVAARTVRFAPAACAGIQLRLPEERRRLVWSAAGSFVGVVQLTPCGSGAVELFRDTLPPEEDELGDRRDGGQDQGRGEDTRGGRDFRNRQRRTP
ncbi:hypothetical protein [Yinghuangia seranimata]|uniref:hypothetical protein n=1 Tax=Yinghuangia seranimata TaxID=408067 RepID=UPI00248AD395|nr:hypothetical protein [Yinghuangia seranimata]MDI2130366.1 hypothetical protein [Yinghuangia seranimata]